MPVDFQQPDPVGQFPGAAAAAGTVAQYNKDREFYLQQLSLQARNQQQAGTARAQQQAMQQQALLQSGQQQLQAAQLGRQPMMQQQGFQNQQALLAQQGQQQGALTQQHAQAQAWLNQQELTQGEQTKLAQLKQQKSAVMANDNLTDEEKQNIGMQLDTGINPLQQRQAQAQIAQIQAKAKLENQQAEMQAAHGATYDQVIAKNLGAADGSSRIPIDPQDLSKGFAGVIVGGKFHSMPPGAVTQGKVQADQDKADFQQWHEAAKVLATKDETGKPIPADPQKIRDYLYEMAKWKDDLNSARAKAKQPAQPGQPAAPRGGAQAVPSAGQLPAPASPDAARAELSQLRQSYHDKDAMPPNVRSRIRQLIEAIDTAPLQQQGAPSNYPPMTQPPPSLQDKLFRNAQRGGFM